MDLEMETPTGESNHSVTLRKFESQCHETVIYFKELLSYSDPDITPSQLLDWEKTFTSHADRVIKGLRVETAGLSSVSVLAINDALRELQEICFSQILYHYQSNNNIRIASLLGTVRSLNTVATKSTQRSNVYGEEEEDDSPSNNNSIIVPEGDTRRKKKLGCTPKDVATEVISRISILQWLPQYNFSKLRDDTIASLAVGLMIIPQGMAYALLAGMPPIYGLYTGFVPLLLYFIFGSSRELAVGPTAMVSLIIPTAVGDFAPEHSQSYVNLVIFYGLIYGIILFLLGALKIGFLLENVLSRPALSGFTQGASILIAASQLKNVLGFHVAHSVYTVDNLVMGVFHHSHEIKLWTSIVGISATIIILIMKKVKKTFPTVILALVVGIFFSWLIDAEKYHIEVIGYVPPGLPKFVPIQINRNLLTKTLGSIIVLTFIGFVEAVSVAKKFAAEHQYHLHVNQELLALGLSNMVGCWFQAYPVSGSLPRTVVNAHTGSKSPMSTLFACIIVMLMLLFGTPLIYYTPVCILAAIVMSAALSIVDYSDVKFLWKMNEKGDLVQFILTDLATAFFGPIVGVATAGFLSLIQVIFWSSRPDIYELGRIPDTVVYRNITRFPLARKLPGYLIVGISAPRLSFYNFSWYREAIETLEHQMSGHGPKSKSGNKHENGELTTMEETASMTDRYSSNGHNNENSEKLHTIIFDFSTIDQLDATAIQYTQEMMLTYKKKKILALFACVKPNVSVTLKLSHIVEGDGEGAIFMTIHDAVEYSIHKRSEDSRNGNVTLDVTEDEEKKSGFLPRILTVDYNEDDRSLL